MTAGLPVRHRTFAWHLRINLGGCERKVIDDVDAVTDWVGKLCKEIDMDPYGPPFAQKFGLGELYGVTALQPITTSSITLHCDPPTLGAFVDIVSCKRYNADIATRFCVAFFGARYLSGDCGERRTPSAFEGIAYR